MSWLLPCFSKKKPEILRKQYPYRDKPAAPASAHGQAQSQEAGEAVSGTVTLRLRSPADFTAVTEIFAVHDYVPESLSWVNPVIVLSATKPLPASMVRDLREHGIRIEAQDA